MGDRLGILGAVDLFTFCLFSKINLTLTIALNEADFPNSLTCFAKAHQQFPNEAVLFNFSLSLLSFISLVLEVIDSQTKMEVKDITSDLKIEMSLTILHFTFLDIRENLANIFDVNK